MIILKGNCECTSDVQAEDQSLLNDSRFNASRLIMTQSHEARAYYHGVIELYVVCKECGSAVVGQKSLAFDPVSRTPVAHVGRRTGRVLKPGYLMASWLKSH